MITYNTLKVAVQDLDIAVDKLEDAELVLAAVDADDEEQRRITAVHDLDVLVLHD